jgi:glycosyltransferase involved in cell wall biosynthesis
MSSPGGEAKHRVLLIGLEFIDPIFSGNGIYSRTIVRSLIVTANYKVHVLCGRPESEKDEPVRVSSHELQKAQESGDLTITAIPLPVWKKLDADSSWQTFGQKASLHVKTIVDTFKPTVAFGVDWTSALPYRNLGLKQRGVPYVLFVFRSFSAQNGMKNDRRAWYVEKETEAAEVSNSCVVLSEVDKVWNVDQYDCASPLNVFTLNPPLREDFHDMWEQIPKEDGLPRKYVTCCSRLEKSKRPDLFVDMVVHCSEFLKKHKYVPLLIGSRTDAEYSDMLVKKLTDNFAAGEFKVLPFQKDPEVLMKVWQQTLLNVHPALYESYGMTIVEAAAFGCPTLLDSGGSIGATDLISEDNMRFTVDMANTELASDCMASILGDSAEKREVLFQAGRRAQQQSLGWSHVEHCKKMQTIIEQSV